MGQVSYLFQQCLSSESMPVLSYAITEIKEYMTALEKLGKDHYILKPWVDIGVQWATKYYCRMDDMKAHVVAMYISFD